MTEIALLFKNIHTNKEAVVMETIFEENVRVHVLSDGDQWGVDEFNKHHVYLRPTPSRDADVRQVERDEN